MENFNAKNQVESLLEWATKEFLDEQKRHRFLQYCREIEGKEATDVISHTELLTLKEQFES